MILIADSGSTKTHWCLMAANGQCSEFQTDGINPFYQTREEIISTLSDQLLPQMAQLLWAGTISRVFFYGAGCTPEKIPVLIEALQSIFTKAEVQVASDMIGAARGLLGHTKGVACILGTGSNSCLWNGFEQTQNVPALGFILGDEGSGAVLGKRLVADLLKNQLGDDLKKIFLKETKLTQADIIEQVYRRPFPNRFLAGLSRFASSHLDDERIYRLVYEHFTQFVVRILRQYPPELPVSFVGSIAYYYRDILSKVLSDNGIVLGQIVVDPIEGLKNYHRPDCQLTM
ncbi:MAG: ATPase [Paludibacteraceae bacterium]|nr:ATPase [Paludibacteraceae bacterium]